MKSFKSTAWILPQPVLIIGTYDKEGKANAMNAAWGGQWDIHEIMISLGSHATTDNLAVNPEFTVTFATVETMVTADYVGIVSGRNTPEKMEKTRWTIEKAPNVNAPVFKEFPMTLECRVKQKIDESETGYYLVAEIVNILCDEKYLVEDGIVDDSEDIEYFSDDEYRSIIKEHMLRETDKHHMVYFTTDNKRIGAAQYNTYQSEDGKCFILDFWVFPEYRGNGTGHKCFEALMEYTKADGASYYEINSTKEDSIRFWKSLGFTENGKDEYDMPLFIKR